MYVCSEILFLEIYPFKQLHLKKSQMKGDIADKKEGAGARPYEEVRERIWKLKSIKFIDKLDCDLVL